jgi:hypothetical protein
VGAHGTASAPIIIASAGDGPVTIDGTISIDGPWTKADKLYSASSHGQEILQLFVDGELQVLARYPNAHWSDKSIFYAVENWFRSTKPGVHNLSTGEGVLQDAGRCTDPSDCCSLCNTHDLALSKVNATGALAIMNLWACDTGVQRITEHLATNASVLRYNASWKGLCDSYANGNGRYYLEGLASFVDTPDEWYFDVSKRSILRLKPPPQEATVRGRVSDFALVVANSSYIDFANLSFHATTMSAAGDVGNLTFTSLTFNYSSVSRRALGDAFTGRCVSARRPHDLAE